MLPGTKLMFAVFTFTTGGSVFRLTQDIAQLNPHLIMGGIVCTAVSVLLTLICRHGRDSDQSGRYDLNLPRAAGAFYGMIMTRQEPETMRDRIRCSTPFAWPRTRPTVHGRDAQERATRGVHHISMALIRKNTPNPPDAHAMVHSNSSAKFFPSTAASNDSLNFLYTPVSHSFLDAMLAALVATAAN